MKRQHWSGRRLAATAIGAACLATSGACAAYDGINCGDGLSSVIATVPALKLAADTPVGTPLWSTTKPFSVNCSLRWLSGNKYAHLRRLNTALANYGLSLFIGYGSCSTGDTACDADTGILVDQVKAGSSNGVDVTGNVTIELRRTGAMPKSGKVQFPSLDAFQISSKSKDDQAYTYKIDGLNTISIMNYSCEVAARSTVVPLGKVLVNEFSGAGSAARQHPFNIRLNCTNPPAANDIALTFKALPDPAQHAGVIAIPSTGTSAKGVGIELKMGNQPVKLDEAIPLGTAASISGNS